MLSKKIIIFLITLTLFIVSNISVPCVFGTERIEFLMDKKYFPEVKKLIEGAKKSVQVMMFEACFYKKYPGSPSNQLIHALMDAAKRGLTVEVILDIQKGGERTTKSNLETAGILKNAGVDVTLDQKFITTHTKLVIIDGTTVVCGSTNWTYSALTKNHEVSAVIYSDVPHRDLQDYFTRVKNSGKKM